ncbi:LysR family transcriptional regulator [Paenibacillus sp. Soil787]|uniref:LysR family transcriptional regulator n=1 Tax=Paenibacillus sp. Soil787 TaxID=1736411 RepID=UPI0006FCD124|nr:LysR family transcriptional regulator [Paenibacillus sp. Soil787]KRF43607.1 LysR family transcriptional regulator [Paenibacillus sp. Soil787]
MELSQLQYFRHVARTENISKSALELHISQPALSKMIFILEKDLGVKLFDRQGKHIKLNHFGTMFLKRVEIALDALEDGRRELEDARGRMIGTLHLSFDVASHIMPDLLREFRLIHPEVTFHLLQHFRNPTQTKFDFCITSSPVELSGTAQIELLREEVFLAVPESHPLASMKTVRLSDVAEDGFITLKRGNSLRETTDAFCARAGFKPRIIFESDDPAMVRGLIRVGQGIAFVPAITWKGTTDSSVVLLRVTHPECMRIIELHWMEDRYLSVAAQAFRQFTKDYFSRLGQSL